MLYATIVKAMVPTCGYGVDAHFGDGEAEHGNYDPVSNSCGSPCPEERLRTKVHNAAYLMQRQK